LIQPDYSLNNRIIILDLVIFEDENFVVRAFSAGDFDKFGEIIEDVYQILTDELTLRFLPEKRLNSREEAQSWLQRVVLNYHTGKVFTYFVKAKSTGHIIGLIDLLSPELIKDHYLLSDYPYFIEFYLKGNAQGLSLMSYILPIVLDKIRHQGITRLAAVVNRKNLSAKRVLTKSGFVYHSYFDHSQDLFETRLVGAK
jgi:RimJ/RimL family protein N-acetyltransferase